MNGRPDDPDTNDGDREQPDFRSPESPFEDLPDDRRDLPEFPDPPDMELVHELRERIREDRAASRPSRPPVRDRSRQRFRDIGTYTIIPMMMVAGPALGYFIGRLVESRWGGEPWPVVAGTLFGLVAAFRQIFLLLSRRQNSSS